MIHFDLTVKRYFFSFTRTGLVKLVFYLFLFVFLSVLRHPVFAYDLTVTCGADCTKSTNDPLFSSGTVWFPGFSQEKSIHILNTRTKSLSLTTSATNPVNTDNLGDVMNLIIKKVGEAGSLWSGTLTNFYASVPISLLTISENNGTADLTYTVTMDTTANNDYQNKTTVFDLNFNFQGDDESPPTPTPTPNGSTDGGGTTDGGDGTTGDGTGGGTPPSNPAVPFLPITQFTTFLPRFFQTLAPAIAGAQTENPLAPEPEKIEEGEVSGAATCQTCIWWPVLLLQALCVTFHYLLTRNRNRKAFWRGGITISVIAYGIFLFLNRDCRSGWQLWLYTDVFWCKYFIVWVLLIFGVLSRIFRPKIEESYEVTQKKPPEKI